MAKGGQFERDICCQLSMWWTGNKRDDIFWRTSGSGARATTRAKKGKTTAGSCGDVAAIDPVGQPFMDMFSIEIKRGYSSHTLHSLIDNGRGKMQVWEEWIAQAAQSARHAGSRSWMIIARRDQRKTIVMIPRDALIICDACDPGMVLRFNGGIYLVQLLDNLLRRVSPSHIRKLVKS